ncbi:MAG: hypothetical protein CMJ70_08460 [Planctomycetaceae bacterium]|nr:hypothetical protein [Planctomycetaceae bacterium]
MYGFRTKLSLLWVALVVCAGFAGGVRVAGQDRRDSPLLRRLPATGLRVADRRTSDRRSARATAAGLRVRQHLAEGLRHVSRRAPDAAQDRFLAALREVAMARVNAQVSPTASQSLANSLVAMREMRDFYAPGATVQLDPYAMAVSHQSPVLKGTSVPGLSARRAIERYSAYATAELAAACGSEPLAAEALYAMGQISSRESLTQLPESRASQLAKIFLSAALRVNSRHELAGNELGVLLARTGAWERALAVLKQSATHVPSKAVWHNLAVVHQYRGEQELATLALSEMGRIQAGPARDSGLRHFSLLNAQRPGEVARFANP